MKNRYVLGNTTNEIKRLELQSSLFEPMATDALKKAGIKNGSVCADIGCGPGYVTKVIGKLVGEKGRVIGMDINENYVKYCKSNIKNKNTSFIYHDITKHNHLFSEKFDLTYSRFMFVHLANKSAALKSMLQMTKRGGTIIIQELDHAPDSWLSYPRRKSVEILRHAYVNLVKKSGGDPLSCRKLYKMFVENKMNSHVECYSPCLVMKQKPLNELGWRIAQSLKNQILDTGLMTATEYQKMFNDLKNMSKDPHSFVIYSRLFSIIGKKMI